MSDLRKYFCRYPLLCEAFFIPLVLGGIFWIFLGKYLGGQYSTATWQDNTHFILPLFAQISRSLAGGEFPYWINSFGGGIPVYNTPQFSILYPLYFFRSGLYRTPLAASLDAHYITLLHVGIMYVSTYIMMRIFHLRIISSVLGSTLFAFCANTYYYLFWVNIIAPYSWLPLALGSVFLIIENRYPKSGLLLGWISIYLLCSASPAQPLIHFVSCSAFLIISFAILHRGDRTKLTAPLRNLVLLAVGSILLSSAVLIPTTLFAGTDMMRGFEGGFVVGNDRIPFRGFLSGETKGSELAKVLFPLKIDQLAGDSYLGLVPVFLALFGVFRWKQNWIVLPLFVLALYTLLSSAGSNLGFAYINYIIPLLNKIREPARHLYVFALATSTLAAFGFEYVTDRKWSDRFAGRKNAFVCGTFLLLLFASYWVRREYETRMNDSTLLWPFVLFLLILCASRFVPSVSGVFQGLLAAIAIYPSVWYPPPIVKVHEGDYFMADNLRSHRVLQEVATIKDIADYRLVVRDKQFNPRYWSMNAAYYGLRTFDAFMNPFPFRQMQEMFIAPEIPRYSQLLGAKYYLSCPALTSTSSTGQNDIQWPPKGDGQITLRNPQTGKIQTLDAGLHDQIAALTYNQGWVPLNQQGNPYRTINFGGGQMFVDGDRDEQAAPLNVILGGLWSPSQLEALPTFLTQHPEVNAALTVERASISVDSGSAPPPAGYSLEREIESCKLYTTSEARPYYFLSTGVGGYYGNAKQFLSKMQRSDTDITNVLIQSSDAKEIGDWLGPATQPLSWKLVQERRSTNSLNLILRTTQRSLLVLNEYFRDEWRVTVNGQNEKSFKVNLNQIAVRLPEGTNEVRFEYRPRLFVYLLYVQTATAGILVAWLLTTLREKSLPKI